MPPLCGRGKKPTKPLREGDRGPCRPSGLIRPSEVAWVGARERADGDHHDHRKHRHPTTWHRRSQQGLRSRIKTKGGATWRMTAHDYGSRRSPWDGPKRPRGSIVQPRCQTWRPARFDKLVGERQGRQLRADLILRWYQMIPRDRRALPSRRVHKGAGREAAFYSCLRWRPFQALLKGIRRWGGTMKMPRARRARGRNFSMVPGWGRDRISGPGPAIYSAATA